MYRNDLIKGKMAELGKGVRQLSEESGLASDTISKIRQGGNVSIETLKKAIEPLGLSLSEIFKEAA